MRQANGCIVVAFVEGPFKHDTPTQLADSTDSELQVLSGAKGALRFVALFGCLKDLDQRGICLSLTGYASKGSKERCKTAHGVMFNVKYTPMQVYINFLYVYNDAWHCVLSFLINALHVSHPSKTHPDDTAPECAFGAGPISPCRPSFPPSGSVWPVAIVG